MDDRGDADDDDSDEGDETVGRGGNGISTG